MNVLSPRERFLKRVGLDYDPFLKRNAEDELEPPLKFAEKETGIKPDKILTQERLKLPLYSYYFPPHITPVRDGESVLSSLRQPKHTFLFAPLGAGKSTLRFLLEADIRARPRNSLVVTYKMGTPVHPLTILQHERQLTNAFATDLFLQVIEQFNPLQSEPTEEQIFALGHQMIIAGSSAERLAKAIIQDPQPNVRIGLGYYSRLIGKFPVRYVPHSEELVELLQRAIQVKRAYIPAHHYENSIEEGLRSARAWGYERVFVLVDGVDGHNRKSQTLLKLIAPLVQLISKRNLSNVYLKFFLPDDLEPALSDERTPRATLLSENAIVSKIYWPTESLIELLDQRFRTAGKPHLPFNTIVGKGLEGRFDRRIAESADGSPRRMLQIVSELIDAHIRLKTIPDKLTTEDWNYMQQRWKYSDPVPAAIEP